MKLLKNIIIITLLILPLSGMAAKKKQSFDGLCTDILSAIQKFYPVKATEMGLHEYDYRFADYSNRSVQSMIKRLTDYEKKLYRYKSAALTSKQRINYKLIKSNVDIILLDLKQIKWHKKSPQLYVSEAVDGLYLLLLSQHAPMSEKIVSIIGRMKAVSQLMSTAQTNIKNPPPVYIETALTSLESGLEFYRISAGELMSQFPDRADEILKISTAAREAMNDFSIFLSELTPGQSTSFSIGTNNYSYKLKNEYFLDLSPRDLLNLGQQLYDEADKNYREFVNYVDSNHQNGTDSIFIPTNFAKADILDYYNWETNQIMVFLKENNIVSIPENIAPVTVIETPPFLRTLVAGIAYQPAGPFDKNQQGFFYVRPIPDDLDRRQLEGRFRYIHRRGFKGSVVHEAFPGHHLQMQLAGQNPDPVRKWQYNLMMIEGWALYCEQMMYENGLYGEEDHSHWLAVLGGIRFRAARIIADVKLHTGAFTYNECVDWMITALDVETESGRVYIKKQVAKYTHAPTMPMTYLMGKREINNLLLAYKNKKGTAFTQKDFHDELLSHGNIPPALLWEIMGLNK